eukprot:5054686-Lingulodinium_polyedra.AAC.1
MAGGDLECVVYQLAFPEGMRSFFRFLAVAQAWRRPGLGPWACPARPSSAPVCACPPMGWT